MLATQGVYSGGLQHANALVKAGQVAVHRFKLMAGYMGWEAGQLRREVTSGSGDSLLDHSTRQPSPDAPSGHVPDCAVMHACGWQQQQQQQTSLACVQVEEGRWWPVAASAPLVVSFIQGERSCPSLSH